MLEMRANVKFGHVLVYAPCSVYKFFTVAKDNTASIFRILNWLKWMLNVKALMFLQYVGTFITTAQCKNPKDQWPL
jgi:hypothetical protein